VLIHLTEGRHGRVELRDGSEFDWQQKFGVIEELGSDPMSRGSQSDRSSLAVASPMDLDPGFPTGAEPESSRRSIAFGLERWGLIPLKAPVATVLVALALAVLAFLGIQRIKTDDSLSQGDPLISFALCVSNQRRPWSFSRVSWPRTRPRTGASTSARSQRKRWSRCQRPHAGCNHPAAGRRHLRSAH
jgi:hypothetical protein